MIRTALRKKSMACSVCPTALAASAAYPSSRQSFGRAGLYAVASCLSWLGLVDYLWCLWDEDSQCLHDKAAKTLVVRDE